MCNYFIAMGDIRRYSLFIKLGEEEFMEKLLYEGELYFNTIDFFTKTELENFRKDTNDGAAYIQQLVHLELYKDDIQIAKAPSAQLYFRHHDFRGNIYCIYAVETNTLDLSTSTIKPFTFDLSTLPFGNTAVLILDPGEFITRVKKEAKLNGYEIHASPVIYYNEKEHRGVLGPFYKSKLYESQNELRFWIPNKLNTPITLKIGNITDIARLIKKTDLNNLRYGPLV